MSCHPGTPCYGSTTVVDPCIAANSSSSNCCDTILYCSTPLPNTGIETNDNLCLALQKIDAEFSNIQVNVDAINGLQKVGDNIKLGGQLVEPTIINIAGKSLSLINVENETNLEYLLVLTSAGVIKRYPATSLGQTVTLEDNVGLVWTDPDETNLSTLYNTLIPDSAQSVQVGGAAPDTAANWKQLTLVQVLDKILFPVRLPTYIEPVVTMTVNSPSPVATLYEVGNTLAFTAVGIGNKWDAGPFTAFSMIKTVNSGSPTTTAFGSITPTTGNAFGTEFGFADPNSPNIIYTTSTFADNITIPAPVGTLATSTVTYQVSGTHNAGFAKKKSDGSNDTRPAGTGTGNPQIGGTKFSSTTTITGIYPVYWGLSDTQPTISSITNAIQTGVGANKLLVSASGTLTIPFDNDEFKYLWVAHPSNGNTPKTKWFVTVQNLGGIGLSTDLFGPVQTSPVSSAITNPIWTGISYKMYIGTYKTRVIDNDGKMELRNS